MEALVSTRVKWTNSRRTEPKRDSEGKIVRTRPHSRPKAESLASDPEGKLLEDIFGAEGNRLGYKEDDKNG
jgi:hypothetical protein